MRIGGFKRHFRTVLIASLIQGLVFPFPVSATGNSGEAPPPTKTNTGAMNVGKCEPNKYIAKCLEDKNNQQEKMKELIAETHKEQQEKSGMQDSSGACIESGNALKDKIEEIKGMCKKQLTACKQDPRCKPEEKQRCEEEITQEMESQQGAMDKFAGRVKICERIADETESRDGKRKRGTRVGGGDPEVDPSTGRRRPGGGTARGGDDSTPSSGTPRNGSTGNGTGNGNGNGSGNGSGTRNASNNGNGAGDAGMLLPLIMAAMMANKQNKPNPNLNQNMSQLMMCPGGMAVPPGYPCPPMMQANGYASPDGVVQANAQLDCTANMAYRYTDCNMQIASACMQNMNVMMSASVCTQFSRRYCNQGYAVPAVYSPYPYPLVAGQVIGNQIVTVPSPAYATDVVGEGTQTSYCLRARQIEFCSMAGYDSCPSCQQLRTILAGQCTGASCTVTSSPRFMQAQLAQCPGNDPLANVPGAIPQLPATAPNSQVIPIVAGPNNGLPPAVLPMASASGAHFASSKRGPAGMRSGSRGEVNGPFGQSLFTTLSTPFNSRCNQGLLKHCGVFEERTEDSSF